MFQKWTKNLAKFPQKWKNRRRPPKIPHFLSYIVLVPACRIRLLEARLPKYHISTARAKRSGASAWASAHALSMVTWYNQNIVNGYRLIMFTHLINKLIPKGIKKAYSQGHSFTCTQGN